MDNYTFHCTTAAEQQQLGQLLAISRDTNPLLIFLQGDLGAGKTTLMQGILKGMGYEGKVKSPTYSLLEPYIVAEQTILHVDLYRLKQPEEILALDLIEQIHYAQLCGIEWPERANSLLPPPDLICKISGLMIGRDLYWQAYSPAGKLVLNRMAKHV